MRKEDQEIKDNTRPKSCVRYASLTSDNYGTIPYLREDLICKPKNAARSQFLRSMCLSRRVDRTVEDIRDFDRNVSIEVEAPAFNDSQIQSRILP